MASTRVAQKPVKKSSPAKGASGKKGVAAKKASSKTSAKKTPATQTPAKKTPAKGRASSKVVQPAKKIPPPKKGVAVKKISVVAKKAVKGRSRNPPVWSPGQLAINATGVVGLQLAGRFITLQEVADAGQAVGLVFPLHAQGTGDEKDMIDKLMKFICDYATGTIIGGVTTCFLEP